jgi:hypothetical protein
MSCRCGGHEKLDINIFVVNYLSSTPSLTFSGYQGSFLVVKLPGHEVNCSALPSTEVRNKCCAPSICLHSMDKENFVFSLSFIYSNV